MVKGPKKNVIKANKKADMPKINQLELTKTKKIIDDVLDEDNDSVNINQNKTKKYLQNRL